MGELVFRLNWGSFFAFLSVSAVCLIPGEPGAAELLPPLPVSPPNGAILQLAEGANQLTLEWARVADATGYLLAVIGPTGFSSFENILIDPTDQPTVSFTVSNIIAGDYIWTVDSVEQALVASGTPHFFTIQSPSTGGGDLPAPTPLQPYNLAILRGTNGRVTFQWTKVEGAETYRVDIETSGPSVVSPLTPIVVGETFVSQTFQISPGNVSRIYTWWVVPIDANGDGDSSEKRMLLFTPEDLVAEEMAWMVSANWHGGRTCLDIDGDWQSNAADALGLLPFQKDGKVQTFEESKAPNAVLPTGGSSVNQGEVEFHWKTAPGAISYELNVLGSNGRFVTTHLIQQPAAGQDGTAKIPLFPGEHTWRVRAFFGSGGTATPFSATRSFSVVQITGKTPDRGD